MQLQLTRWRNVFVLRRVGFLLATGSIGCTLDQKHFACIYEPSATATRVNTGFSEGSAYATLLNKLMDMLTLFVFSLSSKLPGQTVPGLQKPQGSCWPGGLCSMRSG